MNIEESLKEISKIFNFTASDLSDFSSTLYKIVEENPENSFKKVVEVAAVFSKTGLDKEEVLKRVKDALILASLTNIDEVEAANILINLSNYFKEDLHFTQFFGKTAAINAAFTISSRDLALGLARAGETAYNAGVSFDELLNLIAETQQTTARGGAVIGNSLKTIFTRLNLVNVRKQIQEIFGVSSCDKDGRFFDTIEYLEKLAEKYNSNQDDFDKNKLVELVGGIFQATVLKSIFENIQKKKLETKLAKTIKEIIESILIEERKRGGFKI